jgi:hypothetical protein
MATKPNYDAELLPEQTLSLEEAAQPTLRREPTSGFCPAADIHSTASWLTI